MIETVEELFFESPQDFLDYCEDISTLQRIDVVAPGPLPCLVDVKFSLTQLPKVSDIETIFKSGYSFMLTSVSINPEHLEITKSGDSCICFSYSCSCRASRDIIISSDNNSVSLELILASILTLENS